MKWIGLTGSIGSGKSSVATLLRERGIPVVDADAHARQALGPGSEGERKVLSAFGPSVHDGNGHVDRKKLAAEVFSDPGRLSKLEAIIHPIVQEKTRSERAKLKREGHAFAFYDVPLFCSRKNLETQFDAIVGRFSRMLKLAFGESWRATGYSVGRSSPAFAISW